ncbi:MAG: DUF362 domain-containing protein [Spirochaetota bacterium]|nr:DUF362 domain-containing protein [Spirochaetota bacterium]
MNRRDFLEHTLKLSLGALALPISSCSLMKPKRKHQKYGVRAIDSSQEVSFVTGKDAERITEEAINLLGGMRAFVSRGDKVIIKPNMGWARTPEQAATTNPSVIKKVIEMAHNAGASRVSVTDLPCNSASITFERTGIQKAVLEVDGHIYYPQSHRVKEMKLERPIWLPLDKKEIKKWPVFTDFVEADVIINIPIAKHHNLSQLTLGMKNWYGAISGRRNQLHQAIHASIASLANHFRPHLSIIDAIRILLRNGPTGGLIQDTKVMDTVIASRNQVAADAVATTLFGLKPEDIGFIKVAAEFGLGESDLSKLSVTRKVLG